jgi:hypothetical protein
MSSQRIALTTWRSIVIVTISYAGVAAVASTLFEFIEHVRVSDGRGGQATAVVAVLALAGWCCSVAMILQARCR